MNASRPFDDEPDRSLLLRQLNGQRRHVLEQLDGLSDEQLKRSVLPSGWSCLGLTRHLTLSDERYWFEVVMAGVELDFWPDGKDGDWAVDDNESADTIVEAYRTAIENADTYIAQHPLSTSPERPEPWWPEAGLSFPDLRTVIAHVITETATHAGQLDVVRELIDGRQYLVL